MICPKCGYDCGNAKFCPECGEKQQIAAGYAPKLERLPKRTNTKKGSTDIPTSGGYLGTTGSVVLSDSAISIYTKALFKKVRTRIPYDQITTVIYHRPALKPRSNGVLLFRGGSNKDVPIPNGRGIYADNAAIMISPEKDTLFYHIFQMLKAVAPSTAKFEMITPQNSIQGFAEMTAGIDMNYFFDMYAPFRERATDGIHAKYEIPRDVARVLVDSVFDAQQKVLYEADRLDAIRDLNLVVTDMRCEERHVNQQEKESRERRNQDALRTNVENIARIKFLEMLDE